MALTKKQMAVIDELHNGGYIWKAGGTTYLATVTNSGSYKSKPLHQRTWEALLLSGIEFDKENNRWTIK